MEAYDWAELYEYEVQHFGFPPKGFTDVVYNLILEKWAEVVETEIMSAVPLDDVDGETKLLLQGKLVSMICKNNVLNSLMNKLEAYTLKYVFRIPDEVTLPEDKPNLNADKNWNAEATFKRIQELEHDIIKLRLENELLDNEIRHNEQAMRLINAMQQDNDGSNPLDIGLPK